MSPRDIEPRIDWFHPDNDPAAIGMCAQHTWHSLGGDQGDPPAWGCSDANEVVAKVRSAGRYWTTGIPPRGAAVYWQYGANGHAALSNGDGTISTTDPSNGQPTGTEDLDYPRRWGYTGSGDYTLYTDTYNGVQFPIGDDEEDDMPSAQEIADMVWAQKTEDPTNGEIVSMRELLRRTRTVATQARDAARQAADNTD